MSCGVNFMTSGFLYTSVTINIFIFDFGPGLCRQNCTFLKNDRKTQSHTHTHSLSLTHTHSLSHSHTTHMTHTLTHSHHTHTLTHTHTQSLTHTHTHTHTTGDRTEMSKCGYSVPAATCVPSILEYLFTTGCRRTATSGKVRIWCGHREACMSSPVPTAELAHSS